jgi:hypothetical protein
MSLAKKRFRTMGSMLPRVFTTDAVRTTDAAPSKLSWKGQQERGRFRFHDTVISPPTPAENAAWSARMATMSGYDGGLLWQGDLQPVGNAVVAVVDALRRVKGAARQKDALSQAVVALADFGNDLGNSEADPGPAGALAFGHATPQDVQQINDKYWADKLGKTHATDSGRGLSRATPDSINAANAEFWQQQTAWQKG